MEACAGQRVSGLIYATLSNGYHQRSRSIPSVCSSRTTRRSYPITIPSDTSSDKQFVRLLVRAGTSHAGLGQAILRVPRCSRMEHYSHNEGWYFRQGSNKITFASRFLPHRLLCKPPNGHLPSRTAAALLTKEQRRAVTCPAACSCLFFIPRASRMWKC